MPLDHNAVHLALRAQAKPALPAIREKENVAFTPPASDPYSEEDYVPASSRLVTLQAKGGTMLDTGLYVLRWFGVVAIGTTDMNAGLTALLARFQPGTALTLADGTLVRVGGDPVAGTGSARQSATRGQIINLDNGRPVCTVRIPWYVLWQLPA